MKTFLGPVALSLLAASFPSAADSVASTAVKVTMAEKMPLVSKSLLLDIVNCTNQAITVGERGHVMVSADRKSWTQAEEVPTRATLTGVSCFDDNAWAVGHDGTIIHSKDGGRRWSHQRSEVMTDSDAAPQIGAPLMDVLFLTVSKGFAIGAYGLFFETSDGGVVWTQRNITANKAVKDASVADENAELAEDEMSFEDEDPHLNAIARATDGTLMIVGERGVGFRSNDDGASWESVKLPYSGSMFGIIALDTGHFLAFGLRGNAFETLDDGVTWVTVSTGTDLSLMGGQSLPNGGALLVGGNGVVLARRNQTESFSISFDPAGSILSGVLAFGTPEVVLIGENGISSYEPK